MVDVKEMPSHEKYRAMLDLIDLVRDFAPKFVKNELGQAAADELLEKWAKESLPIPRELTYETKYDLAHRNFLQNWITALNFVADHKEASTDDYMKVAIDAWVRKESSSSLGLKIFRSISSSEAAFEALATGLAYKLQIFTPYTVTELNKSRMVFEMAPCKMREIRGSDDFCLAACQNIIPSWLSKQFNVGMQHKRNGNNCTVSFQPFQK
jgi:hypothetical protein